jgi:CRISPR-associated protein Csb1
MSINYSALQKAPRLLAQVKLRPVQGHRFQPTGFSDLGAARYTLPDGTEMLLVESAQSVANRTEAACWESAKNDLISELVGLPYIAVRSADGRFITSSILEAHRINSEYIMKTADRSDTDFKQSFTSEIAYAGDAPVDWRKFYDAVLKYDPCSLIHGCFLEEIAGRLRITRALSGFIEASHVRVAESGGVKNNIVEPKLKGGEGNVPFPRTEFVAKEIVAYFNLDLALIRGFGFAEAPTKLLIALSLFKIRRFLSIGLRLRTACDLMTDGELVVSDKLPIPSEDELLAECASLIKESTKAKAFADPAITTVTRP